MIFTFIIDLPVVVISFLVNSVLSFANSLGVSLVVAQLPFGMDAVFSTMFGWIHGVLYELPFLQIVWNLMLLYYTFVFVFWILRLLHIVR